VLVLLIFLGIQLYEFTESPDFCARYCHSMEPYVQTYENPGNNTILQTHIEHEVECADCHNGPGIIGTAKSRIAGLTMVLSELSNEYDADNLQAEVPNEHCSKGQCHGSVDWVIQTVTGEEFHPFTNNGTKDPEIGESCTTCHNPRIGGTGLSKASCALCHDLTPEELNDHETRTCGKTTCHGKTDEIGHRPTKPKEDACINCHNRLHPSDARVPYSVVDSYEREGVHIDLSVNNDFCSDCHREEFDGFTATSTGECRDCHSEHKETFAPHESPADLSFECNDCHQSLSTQHSPQPITFRKFIATLDNEFCSTCHNEEYEAYTNFNTGSCTDCHIDHEKPQAAHIIPTATFETCTLCHYQMEQRHDPSQVNFAGFPKSDFQNELCSSCHYDEFNVFTSFNTGSCLDCHSSHSKPGAPHITTDQYDACKSCHSSIDSRHDPKEVIFDTSSIWIDQEFCSGCHKNVYESLTDPVGDHKHTSRPCVNCHGVHREVQVDFGNCVSCHSENLPSTPVHNKSTTGCPDCHDVNRYIHDIT
jgi:predicted CXXCH cytochrome family protein